MQYLYQVDTKGLKAGYICENLPQVMWKVAAELDEDTNFLRILKLGQVIRHRIFALGVIVEVMDPDCKTRVYEIYNTGHIEIKTISYESLFESRKKEEMRLYEDIAKWN